MEKHLNTAELVAVTLASKLAPWIVSLAAAILTWQVGRDILGWTAAMAIAMGLGMELAGVSAVHTYFRVQTYNQRATKGAGTGGAWFAVISYFTSLMMVALSTLLTDIRAWVPLMVPLLAASTAVAMGQSTAQTERERILEQEYAQQREDDQHERQLAHRRELRRERREHEREQRVHQGVQVVHELDHAAQVRAYLDEHPLATQVQAAQVLNISRNTVRKYDPRRNGHH